MSNGTLAIKGDFTNSLYPFKVWGTLKVGESRDSYSVPKEQLRCQDRWILLTAISHGDDSSFDLKVEAEAFSQGSITNVAFLLLYGALSLAL